jgi:hypothetical protein
MLYVDENGRRTGVRKIRIDFGSFPLFWKHYQQVVASTSTITTMVRAPNERSNGFYVTIAVCFLSAVLLIYHDLGVVAFCLLVFVGIFGFGLREKFSTEETASAYSVFNKDGRSIVGGFTATQFERQMRGPLASADDSDNPLKGPLAVHDDMSKSRVGELLLEPERVRRRKAAAEAAQRRLQTKVCQ